MKTFLLTKFFILILIQIAVVKCAITEGNLSHPDYPGKCYNSADEIYEPGEHQIKNGCGRVFCSENGFATFHSCGVSSVSINGPCTPGDPVDGNAPYPDCCKRYFHCKDENGKEIIKTL